MARNALYRGKYWNTAQCPYVPELLKYPMFSCAVNCGHKVAIILLQRAAGVKDDGIFGKITRTTCNSLPQRRKILYKMGKLLQGYCKKQAQPTSILKRLVKPIEC